MGRKSNLRGQIKLGHFSIEIEMKKKNITLNYYFEMFDENKVCANLLRGD